MHYDASRPFWEIVIKCRLIPFYGLGLFSARPRKLRIKSKGKILTDTTETVDNSDPDPQPDPPKPDPPIDPVDTGKRKVTLKVAGTMPSETWHRFGDQSYIKVATVE